MNYDIIGDIHGHTEKLERLLPKLGYHQSGSTWRHSERQAIFLGDFIDRGPQQVASYRVARRMFDAGNALAVMGNHELNALAWNTVANGRPLRAHTKGNRHQHAAFLDEVEQDRALHSEITDWFAALPLWLDLPGFRVVHACWHSEQMREVETSLTDDRALTSEALVRATQGDHNIFGVKSTSTPEFRCVETLTKGREVALPHGCAFEDADGIERHSVRIRWWDTAAVTVRDAALLAPKHLERIPAEWLLPPGAVLGYRSEKPLFIGHYWMTGTPTVLAPNLACVDYSAGKGGALIAYRWDGETVLDNAKFVTSD